MLDASIDRFRREWRRLTTRLGLPADRSNQIADLLVCRYTEPSRHYHDVRHVVSMLDQAAEQERRFAYPDAVRLAVFFHDLIYEPAKNDNESRSAEDLRETLSETDVPGAIIEKAVVMILATNGHRPTSDSDANLFLDIDMSVLAAPWPDYVRYAEGVMREYTPVYGEAAYRKGRVDLFIRPTLSRGVVFLTDAYTPKTDAALENLAREEEILTSGAGFVVSRNIP